MNTTTINNTTMANARSLGKRNCSRLCTGHTMAMTKRAKATGAKTELAK